MAAACAGKGSVRTKWRRQSPRSRPQAAAHAPSPAAAPLTVVEHGCVVDKHHVALASKLVAHERSVRVPARGSQGRAGRCLVWFGLVWRVLRPAERLGACGLCQAAPPPQLPLPAPCAGLRTPEDVDVPKPLPIVWDILPADQAAGKEQQRLHRSGGVRQACSSRPPRTPPCRGACSGAACPEETGGACQGPTHRHIGG